MNKSKSKTRRPPIFRPTSFGQAVRDGVKLLQLIDSQELSKRQVRLRVDKFMNNSDNARGFCIALLTGDFTVSDNPSAPIVASLRNGSPAVFEVMAKNVVMAPTMAVTHRRNSNLEAALGSDKSTQRAIKLVHLMKSPAMNAQLLEMHRAFRKEASAFSKFVSDWKYLEDAEQTSAGLKAIEQALACNNI
jgi:hypothetical protein